MDFSTVLNIIEKWQLYERDINEFDKSNSPYYYNVKRVMGLYRELGAFLQTHEPVLRTWMMDYLEKHRNKIFVRWWGDHVNAWAKAQIEDNFPKPTLHPDTETIWDSVFGSDRTKKFSLARDVVENARSKRDIKNCDDLTILAIHEGVECKSNGWYCDDCESMEYSWYRELVRRVCESNHPLLNPDRQTWYRQDTVFPESWEPPHTWGKIYGPCGRSDVCYDFSEFVEYMKSTRQKAYNETGQTPIQATKRFISETLYNGGWAIWIPQVKKEEYGVFLALWNILDLLQIVIPIDLERVAAIDDMFVVTVTKLDAGVGVGAAAAHTNP